MFTAYSKGTEEANLTSRSIKPNANKINPQKKQLSMKFIFTIPLADWEIKTNANTLAEAMEEAKRFNCSELANNPEYDYTMLQVEDLDNGRVFDVFTYPGKGNRVDVKHEITEYDWYGNEVDEHHVNCKVFV